MSAFTLDTSGVIPACVPTSDPNILGPCGFHDLDPFTQGYVEALFASAGSGERRCLRCNSPSPTRHPAVQHGGEVQICSDPWHVAGCGFSDLSPSALERIVRDCADPMQRHEGPTGRPDPNDDTTPGHNREYGKQFWAARQGNWLMYAGRDKLRERFPPLTVCLDDAGKVTLADRVPA